MNYDESLVFVTIWDVPMTSSVERTNLDFKISVALIQSQKFAKKKTKQKADHDTKMTQQTINS